VRRYDSYSKSRQKGQEREGDVEDELTGEAVASDGPSSAAAWRSTVP
jgi:hypothetical protein